MKRKLPYAMVVFLISFLIWENLFQQAKNKEQLVNEKNKIEAEIELTNKLLSDTRSKKENTLSEYKLLNRKIDNRNLIIRKLNNEIALINNEIEQNQHTLNLFQEDLKKAKKEYSDLIYHAFKSSNHNLNFMYLLASEDINQFYLRLKYLEQYKAYRTKQIRLIQKLNFVIEEKLVRLNKGKTEKIDLINRKLLERANLKNEIDAANRILGVLKSKESDLEMELDKKRRIAERLEKEIESIIEEEGRRNRFASLTPEEKIISDDFEKNMGILPWPTKQGIITEFFGENEYPDMNNLKVRNNGIDIATVENSYVRAIFKGEVSSIFAIKGANSTVLVRHGNYFSVYHNLVNVRVKVGDNVETKEILGNVYSDRRTGESIVHLEIWKETELMNPSEWLSN
jgi:septal ring factor EnvC (AmiA/AmiB activator)